MAHTADEFVDYLLTAHHYAQRIITSAIIAAHSLSAEQQQALALQGLAPPSPLELPDNLAGWATFDLSEEVFKVSVAVQGRVHALGFASLNFLERPSK